MQSIFTRPRQRCIYYIVDCTTCGKTRLAIAEGSADDPIACPICDEPSFAEKACTGETTRLLPYWEPAARFDASTPIGAQEWLRSSISPRGSRLTRGQMVLYSTEANVFHQAMVVDVIVQRDAMSPSGMPAMVLSVDRETSGVVRHLSAGLSEFWCLPAELAAKAAAAAAPPPSIVTEVVEKVTAMVTNKRKGAPRPKKAKQVAS